MKDISERSTGKSLGTQALADFEARLARFSASIRSPMQVALGTAELLLDTKLDSGQVALVNAFIQATESALAELQGLCKNSESSYIPCNEGFDADSFIEPASKTILVVDDNRVSLTLTKEALEREGFNVRTAVDGREALDVFRTRPISLILMDLEMPILNGFQACQAIRKEECDSAEKVPIVALTAETMDGVIERSLRQGFDGYLAKPISRAQLLDSVRKMMGKRKS